MKSFAALAILVSGLFLQQANQATAAETVLFRDDFNGSLLNYNNWYTARGTLGRTQFGTTPTISGGVAHFYFDTYKFKGTSIFSTRTFTRDNGLTFEARIKLNGALPNGLVSGFYAYAKDTNGNSDETDFELLTNQLNDNMTYSSGDPVLLTNMNDWDSTKPAYGDPSHYWSYLLQISGLDVTQWHTYRVTWSGTETIWSVDGNEYRTANAYPTAPTPVWLNFWAPSSDWQAAYDSQLQPATRSSSNARYEYQVDYVQVSVVTP